MGVVTLSLEIELGWGNHYPNPEVASRRLSEGRRDETEALQQLLTDCDESAIPFSFDVVGHLLLEECSGVHSGPHRLGWFKADPGTDVATDPIYYAPDLIAMIDERRVDHEICTHTFSHVRCGEVSADVVAWELMRAKDVHQERGLCPPKTMVPPFHSEPPIGVVAKNGIYLIRIPTHRVNDTRPSHHPLQFNWVTPHSIPWLPPELDGNVVISYSTPAPTLSANHLPSEQDRPHPVYEAIPVSLRQFVQMRYFKSVLRFVSNNDVYVHLWGHLYDIANEQQLRPIRYFLRELRSHIDESSVRVLTMENLADRFGGEEIGGTSQSV